MNKIKILIPIAFILLILFNLNLISGNEKSISSTMMLNSITQANAESNNGWVTGTSTSRQCEIHRRTIYITVFKWYVNGEVVWSPHKPSISATGGVESSTTGVEEVIHGIEYYCPGIGQCQVVHCYTINN